jgi:predicted dehydrogenase
MTNLAAHELDILQWFTEVKGPLAVTSTGGRFGLDPATDNGETPDTQDALVEYPGFTALWSHREASMGRRLGYASEIFGTKGSLTINRSGFEVTPDMKVDPANAIPVFKGHPGGGPQRSEAKPQPWIQAMKEPGDSAQQLDSHVRNFLDCVKSRQAPVADPAEGHRTATTCHLANISLRLGRKIKWDADKQEIIGDAEATAMMVRPYRKPWDGVLRSILA